MELPEAFASRYRLPGEHGDTVRAQMLQICQAYLDGGLGDRNSEQRLCSQDDYVYWQQLSEVLIWHELSRRMPVEHRDIGPDFLIRDGSRNVWVEVITPEPTNIPIDWLTDGDESGVYSLPSEPLLLRWTAAIKEKAEKLLGNADLNYRGYLAQGVVDASDVYVIAINGRLLRSANGAFPQLEGISQLPFAAEAALAVGPLAITVNRETVERSAAHQTHRAAIRKPNGSEVPANTFLDPAFAPISAIWALDIDESVVLGRSGPMAMVHNPHAINPLRIGLLPANAQFITECRGDHYTITRI